MRLSKEAKNRIKMMTSPERKSLAKCAKKLAEANCITFARANAIVRWSKKGGF